MKHIWYVYTTKQQQETLITNNSPQQGEDILLRKKSRAKKKVDHSQDIIFVNHGKQKEPEEAKQKHAALISSKSEVERNGVSKGVSFKVDVNKASKLRATIGAVPFWTLHNYADGIL